MTQDQAKQLYIAAGGPDDYDDGEWKQIHQGIEAICAAKSDRAEAEPIRWWGCWQPKYTATAFARRVRQAYHNL